MKYAVLLLADTYCYGFWHNASYKVQGLPYPCCSESADEKVNCFLQFIMRKKPE
jgi:hypothetical protein